MMAAMPLRRTLVPLASLCAVCIGGTGAAHRLDESNTQLSAAVESGRPASASVPSVWRTSCSRGKANEAK